MPIALLLLQTSGRNHADSFASLYFNIFVEVFGTAREYTTANDSIFSRMTRRQYVTISPANKPRCFSKSPPSIGSFVPKCGGINTVQLQASYRMQKKRSDEISLANEKLSVLRGHLFETCIKRFRRKAEIRPNLLFLLRICYSTN